MIDKLKVVKNSQSRKPKTASKNSLYLDANFYQIGSPLHNGNPGLTVSGRNELRSTDSLKHSI